MTKLTSNILQVLCVPVGLAFIVVTMYLLLSGINSHNGYSVMGAAIGAAVLFGIAKTFQWLEQHKR